MTGKVATAPRHSVGRYAIHGRVGAGGMATVYLGRVEGAAGFSRLVAIKALHPHLLKEGDGQLARMFADEARLAARVRHPNVVATLDVVETNDGELFQILEWIDGESLARLAPAEASKDRKLVPLGIAVAIMAGVLAGLHAAHEAKSEKGEPLGIVHRDVSPQNIMIGEKDGIARVLDFGVAKAVGRDHTTKDGRVRGKLRYMPAEQLQGKPATRENDIYAAGVILWELITGLPLVEHADEAAIVTQVLTGIVEPPSAHRKKEVPTALDDLVLRALARDSSERFSTAREMALALQACGVVSATPFEVAEWVQTNAKKALEDRAALVAAAEREDEEHAEEAIAAAAPVAPLPAQEATASRATASDVPKKSPKGGRPSLVTLGIGVFAIVVLGMGALAIASSSTNPGAAKAASPSSASGTATEPSRAAVATVAAVTSVVEPPTTTTMTTTTTTTTPATNKPAAVRPVALPPPSSSSSAVKPAEQPPRRRDGTEDWK